MPVLSKIQSCCRLNLGSHFDSYAEVVFSKCSAPKKKRETTLTPSAAFANKNGERAPIPPTTEAAVTQKNETKENSEVQDQRSNRKHVLDKIRHPEQTFAAALHRNLPGVRYESPASSNSRFKDVIQVWSPVYTLCQ